MYAIETEIIKEMTDQKIPVIQFPFLNPKLLRLFFSIILTYKKGITNKKVRLEIICSKIFLVGKIANKKRQTKTTPPVTESSLLKI